MQELAFMFDVLGILPLASVFVFSSHVFLVP